MSGRPPSNKMEAADASVAEQRTGGTEKGGDGTGKQQTGEQMLSRASGGDTVGRWVASASQSTDDSWSDLLESPYRPGVEKTQSARTAGEPTQDIEPTHERGEPLPQRASSSEHGQVHEDRDTHLFDRTVTSVEDLPTEGIIGDRYRIVQNLGGGGMAHIFRVQHVNLGKHFALKIIHRTMSTDLNIRQMFFREAQVASSLNHPSIVSVTDFGVDEQYGAFIVMEYLEGETLKARLESGRRLTLALKLEVMTQIGQALHYMHNQNFIHCDVKSENVLLCHTAAGERKRTQVKLIDFGLSRAEALGAKLATSEMGGTPGYISPEQIRGQAPQPSMDIYSLGVLFYELLTGQLPFNGNAAELLDHHLSTPPSPPSVLLDEPVDERLEELVLGLLAKDPMNRPASMGQVIYQLRTLTDMLGLGRTRSPRAITTKLPTRRKVELQNLRALVSSCPCPLFRIAADGTLLVVNRAFCNFVRVDREDAVGAPIDETRFNQIFPELMDRIEVSVVTKSSKPLVKTTSFGDGKETVRVKVVLVPEKTESGEIEFFSGVIHSLGEG